MVAAASSSIVSTASNFGWSASLPDELLQATPAADYRRSLTPKSTHVFVSCRLDYCNSLYAGVADVHICRLQLV